MRIVEADIEDRGWYDAQTRSVVVRAGMTWAARRSTLAHELVHVQAGDRMRPGLWADAHREPMEDRANEIAARNLIPLDSLTRALVECETQDEAADLLNVDVDMVKARLRFLTAGERWHVEQVTRRLA